MVLEINDVRGKNQRFTGWQALADLATVVNFFLTGVAVVATLFRLYDRQRTGRIWWDDAWAGFCMILLVIFMVAVEVHVQDPGKNHMSFQVSVCAHWLMVLSTKFAPGQRRCCVYVIDIAFLRCFHAHACLSRSGALYSFTQ